MNRPICVLTIIVIVAIIGLHSCGVVFFDYDKVYELDGTNEKFEGIILGKKSETDYKTTYIIKIKKINEIFAGKKFLLDVKKKDYSKELEYGDIITFNGIYNKPNGQRNYGGYDYSLYLKTQDIYGTFDG